MRSLLPFTALALLVGLPALAQDIVVHDPYARVSGPAARSGAIFMGIENTAQTPDRLIGLKSDIADRVELHRHSEDANGVMRMSEIEDGIALPAGARHDLARGGDHVMLLGLTRPLAQGDSFTLTLSFAQAGDMDITVPVDLERIDAPQAEMPPNGHAHGHKH